MTFNEYLKTDNSNSQIIFDYYLNFLEELLNKKYPFEEQLKLKGAANKFLSALEVKLIYLSSKKDNYEKLITNFQSELSIFRKWNNVSFFYTLFYSKYNKKRIIFRIESSFQELYSTTVELINEASNKTEYFDDLKVNDFYKPDKSNKVKIKELINEAIELIKEDITLSEKSKNKIIEYLEKAIKELEKEYVNWTRFLGLVKETIIVLGALGSFAGGAALFKAQEKLEETSIIVQKTSININFNVISETFNIQNVQQINSINKILQIPENKNNQDIQKIDNIEDIEPFNE